MTTATATQAQFDLPDCTQHDRLGESAWSVAVVEGPLTSYSLTPEQTARGGPASLSSEPGDNRASAPSVTIV